MTPKTLADVKGGTLISYEGKVQVFMLQHIFRLTAMGMDSQKSHYDTSSNDNQTSASEILLYYAKFLMFHLHILDLMCPGISFCFSLLPSPLSIEEEYNLCLIDLITFIM